MQIYVWVLQQWQLLNLRHLLHYLLHNLVICPNDCSEITAVGTSSFVPFTYAWSNDNAFIGDSTLMCSDGIVTVTFTDAQGCVATNTIAVVDDVIPVASFTSTPPSPVTPTVLIDFEQAHQLLLLALLQVRFGLLEMVGN